MTLVKLTVFHGRVPQPPSQMDAVMRSLGDATILMGCGDIVRLVRHRRISYYRYRQTVRVKKEGGGCLHVLDD